MAKTRPHRIPPPPIDVPMPNGDLAGTVQRLKRDQGYGFIRGSDGLDYFFHASGLRGLIFETLDEGTAVIFTPTEGAKGLRAEEIRPKS